MENAQRNLTLFCVKCAFNCGYHNVDMKIRDRDTLIKEQMC